jgi:shikimate dehydrogenase
MTISARTRVLGVIGDPVAHSLSPMIHNTWIKAAGLDAVYVGLRVSGDYPAETIRGLWRAGLTGLNVTLPHKAEALKAAASRSREAEVIGAANTLAATDAGWAAHNTDAEGFAAALREAMGAGPSGKSVVLIGAGGAARAALWRLGEDGARTVIANRTRTSAETMAAELSPSAGVVDLTDFEAAAVEADAVVNSASFGHAGELPVRLPPGRGRPFLDMSYGKAAALTRRAAEAAGWEFHDGLGMLVAQAAAAFRLWFGVEPDVGAARQACEAAVRAQAGDGA